MSDDDAGADADGVEDDANDDDGGYAADDGDPYFILVTTITTAGCVKKSVKCKNFQLACKRKCSVLQARNV